jgi:Na+-driven multidrug efflux pump
METQELTAAPQTIPLWKSIREALRGSHQDFTTGSLNRAILLLAIPMVLEMVLESLFAVVDVFWVGRLGADAVATVGLTESLLSLVFAVGLGLSLSTTAMVARRIGEKDPAGAAVAGVQAIIIGIVISLLVGVPCAFLGPRLLSLMGASPQIVAVGGGYARIALGGSGAIMLLFLNNAIFRGAGDAAIARRLLWACFTSFTGCCVARNVSASCANRFAWSWACCGDWCAFRLRASCNLPSRIPAG